MERPIDYDRDGFLDVFVSHQNNVPCSLYRNKGDLAFEDVSVPAGIVHPGAYRHCSAGDVDNDGWPDVGRGRDGASLRLYVNRADGTFAEAAGPSQLANTDRNFGLVLEDFDNDGWMDAFFPHYELIPAVPSSLYVNNSGVTFTDVTSTAGTTSQTDMGHNTGDLDADGFPDVLIGTGAPALREPRRPLLRAARRVGRAGGDGTERWRAG